MSHYPELEGKRALVTGGTKGVGEASDTHRFFVALAANRIAPNTHQVQALCQPRTRPGGVATPEEHWYRVASKSLLTVQWLPIAWHQSRVGSRRRRSGF